MILKFKQRPASALVITLLMISVISTVSFAVASLSMSEFRKASNLQDSIAAYYAAESGLEHGLLQYRLAHDAEISKEVYSHVATSTDSTLPLLNTEVPTSAQGTAQRFRLDGGIGSPGYVPADDGNIGTSFYDLKMWYRGDYIGAIKADGAPVVDAAKSPRVYRDSAADYNINGARYFQIAWQPDIETKNNPPEDFPDPIEGIKAKYFIQLTFSTNDKSCMKQSVQVFYKVDIYAIQNAPLGSLNPDKTDLKCNYNSLRIKPWNMNYAQYSLAFYDAQSHLVKLDTNRTNISSVGYSGKSKRTLDIDLSRSVGTVLESQDFLFLSSDKGLNF